MKIAIKITTSQFRALMTMFESYSVEGTLHLGRETRVRRYILEKVIQRMRKQQIDAESNLTLFNQKKKIKISLEYYEAHFLEIALGHFEPHQDVYTRNALRIITAELNAKLA